MSNTWQTELTTIVRNLINDVSESPTYSDARIQQLIATAAKFVEFDVVLDTVYDVNVTTSTITPDPIVNNDTIFVSLTCLKAACLVDQSTLRTKAAMEGIRASLGPANLSVGGSLEGYKMLLEKGPCALYAELTEHWDVQNATAIHAILSPFVGNKFDAKNLNNSTIPRFRYDTFYS
jgi:hypothetical protein